MPHAPTVPTGSGQALASTPSPSVSSPRSRRRAAAPLGPPRSTLVAGPGQAEAARRETHSRTLHRAATCDDRGPEAARCRRLRVDGSTARLTVPAKALAVATQDHDDAGDGHGPDHPANQTSVAAGVQLIPRRAGNSRSPRSSSCVPRVQVQGGPAHGADLGDVERHRTPAPRSSSDAGPRARRSSTGLLQLRARHVPLPAICPRSARMLDSSKYPPEPNPSSSCRRSSQKRSAGSAGSKPRRPRTRPGPKRVQQRRSMSSRSGPWPRSSALLEASYSGQVSCRSCKEAAATRPAASSRRSLINDRDHVAAISSCIAWPGSRNTAH